MRLRLRSVPQGDQVRASLRAIRRPEEDERALCEVSPFSKFVKKDHRVPLASRKVLEFSVDFEGGSADG